jgi:hypothetical protein
MELVIQVEKLRDKQFTDADELKDITVTGKVLSIHFKDGAVQEAMDKAAKFDELQQLEIEHGN